MVQDQCPTMTMRFRHKSPNHLPRLTDEEVELTVADAIAISREVWFGSAGSCPSCGRQGVIAWIDVDRGRSRSWCEACDVEWDLVETGDGRALPPGAATTRRSSAP
jgi:hypothetical protein